MNKNSYQLAEIRYFLNFYFRLSCNFQIYMAKWVYTFPLIFRDCFRCSVMDYKTGEFMSIHRSLKLPLDTLKAISQEIAFCIFFAKAYF